MQPKIHSRTIQVTTYEYEDGAKLILEGSLKDERCQESRVITGEKFPPGVVHHMVIRMTVNCSNLVIEAIEVDLISVPREICRETIACLDPVKGMTITKGFTARVKDLVGGEKGCTHLVELLLAMAPVAIQGYAASRSKRPAAMDPVRAEMTLRSLVNTCRIWREEGPFVKKFKQVFDLK